MTDDAMIEHLLSSSTADLFKLPSPTAAPSNCGFNPGASVMKADPLLSSEPSPAISFPNQEAFLSKNGLQTLVERSKKFVETAETPVTFPSAPAFAAQVTPLHPVADSSLMPHFSIPTVSKLDLVSRINTSEVGKACWPTEAGGESRRIRTSETGQNRQSPTQHRGSPNSRTNNSAQQTSPEPPRTIRRRVRIEHADPQKLLSLERNRKGRFIMSFFHYSFNI
jgi:hypothetical protein